MPPKNAAPQSGAPRQTASHLARPVDEATLSGAPFFGRLRSNTRERGSPPPDARSSFGWTMSEESQREVRAGLERCLGRLWRYGVMLSRSGAAAEDLVQATCLRAIERADQFVPGTHLDRWLFVILRSIWLNEMRARRIRESGGFVDAEDALSFDGARTIETNILAAQVLTAISRLPRRSAKRSCSSTAKVTAMPKLRARWVFQSAP